MEKKSLEESKEGKPTDAVPSPCPLCGTTDTERSAISSLDTLLQSHLELCAVLRLVGRQLLRYEHEHNHPFDKLRTALRRAENIQHALKLLETHPKALKRFDSSDSSGYEPVTNEVPVRKKAQRRNRLRRPRSLRVVRLPPADLASPKST